MSMNITKQGDTIQADVIECMVDYRTDILSLPTSWAPGSTAIVVEDSSVWMLNTEKIWIEI